MKAKISFDLSKDQSIIRDLLMPDGVPLDALTPRVSLADPKSIAQRKY